jgi:hypothetical protein
MPVTIALEGSTLTWRQSSMSLGKNLNPRAAHLLLRRRSYPVRFFANRSLAPLTAQKTADPIMAVINEINMAMGTSA